MSASPFVCLGRQWTAAYCAAVSLAHANQLPLPRLLSVSGLLIRSAMASVGLYFKYLFTFYL